ncbi:MAG: oxygen-independent coproporphyrinogen III oxidase-like protein [Sulfuricella sp.]|nr:oxygen-independent coproporphyrinogen III oxidase-like protein [Sulfuricella sp.]
MGNGHKGPSLIPHPPLLTPPLSLYIHIPWCVRKCPYCDFNSHEAKGGVPEQEYVAALIRDLEMALPQVWGRKVVSLFIGGGTPSLFSPRAVDELLAGIRARLPVEAGAEITMEANPGTVEAGKFAEFRAAGITRLSLGIQSFNPRHLQALGRIHDDREAHAAVAAAMQHFDNVNLDLMYGLPGQGLDEALADIRAAIAYRTTHLSAYNLTLEPNTRFYAAPPTLPDEDACAVMQEAIEAELAGAGFEHYETSAFAQPQLRCRHNLNYWHYGDYLGLGAGAHGKLTFCDRIARQVRPRAPHDYLAAIAAGKPAEEHEVAVADRAFEFMMNALRLTGGFDPRLFTPATSLPLAAIESAVQEAERRGLLERDAAAIRPTLLGQRFLNELLQLFLPEDDAE